MPTKKIVFLRKGIFFRFKFFFIMLIIGVIFYTLCKLFFNNLPRYTYKNEPIQDNNIASTNLGDINLNCYLDESPSMLGFFGIQDNAMYNFSKALENLNNKNHFLDNGNTYLCRQEILEGGETSEFFECMRSPELSINHYEDIFLNTMSKPQPMIELSKIFTEIYSNGGKYNNDENIVNMIITDMNFLQKENNIDIHKKQINNFAKQLSDISKDSNICIYNIQSEFLGIQNTDTYNISWNESTEIDHNHSFFVIIVSKNNTTYDLFIDELEKQFEEQNMNFSEQKFELKNNMFKNHEIVLDKSVLKKSDYNLYGLNLDNESINGIPADAVGFRINSQDTRNGFSNMPLEKLVLPGIYFNENIQNNGSQIESVIKIYYRSGIFSYKEYEADDFITDVKAYISKKDEDNWLYLDLNINSDANLPKGPLSQNCAVINIRFQLIQPQYTVPQWVTSIDTKDISSDWSKKINIVQLFKKIVNKKEENYAENISEFQQWMGNLLIYVFY